MATRGRRPRKSKFKPKAGRKTVTVRPHRRSPRGPNRGKPRPRVRPYKRNSAK